jgi:predicted PurR-regulated permease PerM
MDTVIARPGAGRHDVAALVVMAAMLFFVLKLHLLSALLAGLLVYEIVHLTAPRLPFLRGELSRAKLVSVGLIATCVVVGIAALVITIVALVRSDAGSLSALLQKMAETLEGSRTTLPGWAQDWIPTGNGEELKGHLVHWLREHAKELTALGGEAGRSLAHALIGLVIGALVSLREVTANTSNGPLAVALVRCLARLGEAFRRIVFAQVRISALNTVLTAIYLAAVLPALGVHLPLTKTMIVLTFVVGLLPVLGNLISNTVIVVISLGYSMHTAMGSLAFLVVIHKLEYFINARIVGSQIHASAWELLVAMLVMESAFGLPGVIAAPVFYAYGKSELEARGLI